MLKLLKNLFSKNSPSNSSNSKSQPQEHELRIFFEKELADNKFIKPESKSVVLQHLTGEINILKTDNKLTIEEKKELGINARLSVTKELIAVLTNEGISHEEKPRDIIENIYHRARTEKYRIDELEKIKQSEVSKKIKLMNCEDERTCEWCKSTKNKEFSIKEDINLLVKSNCKSAYCRCALQAVIKI